MKLPPGSSWLRLALLGADPASGTLSSPAQNHQPQQQCTPPPEDECARTGRGVACRGARSGMQMSGREVSGSWKKEQTEWPPRLQLRAPRSAGAPDARRSAGASAASSTPGGTGSCTVWVRKAGLTPAREGGRGLSIRTDPRRRCGHPPQPGQGRQATVADPVYGTRFGRLRLNAIPFVLCGRTRVRRPL